MKRKAENLPRGIFPRALTRAEAAAIAGLSPGAFATAVARGLYPQPTLPGQRIDRKLLELAMDRLSGLADNYEDDPLSAWEARRHAREA